MAIDIVARGLAASLTGANGRFEADRMPQLEGTSSLSNFNAIGGLTDATLVEGKTAEEILMMMLYGVVTPRLVEPSFSVSLNEDNDPLIIGRESLLKGALVFNRGKIDPAFGTSGYRAGAPIKYIINGLEFESNALTYDFEIEVLPMSESMPFEFKVEYAEGDQPLDSAGRPVGSALPQGMLTSHLELSAAHPLYNGDEEEISFSWFDEEDGSGYLATFAAETEDQRQSFAVSKQTTVVGIKAFNVLSQQWEWLGSQTAAISLTYFKVELLPDGEYILYTYDGIPVGSRELKIYVE